MSLPRVVLLPRRARPFYGGHPWVYAGAIAAVEGGPSDGDAVDLYSHAGSFIARGLYNSRSKIRVRLYSTQPDIPLDAAFFRHRLARALALRTSILGLTAPRTACRLVFSEGDGLSGLIVDRYDRRLVVQFTALALAERREMVCDLLTELVDPQSISLRTERGIGRMEGIELKDGPLRGELPAEPTVIEEDGLRFLVHLAEGQKTGFYLDQRFNRRAVARLAGSRRVLDAFCYSGGFGLHAARAGAREVLGIDVSASALELAEQNTQLNDLSGISFVRDNVFHRMQALESSNTRFDLVVLDPPKFARTRQAVEDALPGHKRLHELALRLLDSDGLLVTCCCSSFITAAMLEEQIAQLAALGRRHVQLLERRSQAPDHPILATCPESEYLVCLIYRVW
jgi:23S rRNA (cytosine1962-C5)-methyltransferase